MTKRLGMWNKAGQIPVRPGTVRPSFAGKNCRKIEKGRIALRQIWKGVPKTDKEIVYQTISFFDCKMICKCI